jgi:tRNA(Ile)-lysidine synthase
VKNLSNLSHILQQDCQLDASRLVLVGVSGGPDSLCLLDNLWRLRFQLVVAHLNHGLRSEASAEAAFVREAALARGYPFVIEEADVPTYALSHHLSVEEAARTVRYHFLFKQARHYHAQAVAVAHTADDQVETVLMHLIRGAALSGLRGMSYRVSRPPWDPEIPLVRPLLGIFREEVLRYCSEQNLHPVFDLSNMDNTFFRNRIRNELIPTLEAFNPGLKSSLVRMAQTLAGDDEVLETLMENAWYECCIEVGSDSVAMNINCLMAEPLSIQKRLVRKVISLLRPGLRDITYDMIDKVLSYINEPVKSGKSDLANGLCLLREGEKLWVANWMGNIPTNDWPQMVENTLLLMVPGSIDLPGGWHIIAEPVNNIQEAARLSKENLDPGLAWIDLPNQHPVLTVRSFLPGDRFHPLGMDNHSMKLSDFFVNQKLPRRARQYWPLVCLGKEIAWIPGYRIAHPYRLTTNTKRCIFFQLTRD